MVDEHTRERLKEDAEETVEDKFSGLPAESKLGLATNFLNLDEQKAKKSMSEFGVKTGAYNPDTEYGSAFINELYEAFERKSSEIVENVVETSPNYDSVEEWLEDHK